MSYRRSWRGERAGLHKIRQAKAELEEEARQRAEQAAAQAQAEIDERRLKEQQTGQKAKGREPKVIDPQQACPSPKHRETLPMRTHGS